MYNFLVTELDDDVLDIICEEFIQKYFGDKEYFSDIAYDIQYYEDNIGTPNFKREAFVEIVFTNYKYTNNLEEELCETVGVWFEEKGLQPFYIDGKFETKLVYEAISLSPIQKHDFIYGIGKREISEAFWGFITTC